MWLRQLTRRAAGCKGETIVHVALTRSTYSDTMRRCGLSSAFGRGFPLPGGSADNCSHCSLARFSLDSLSDSRNRRLHTRQTRTNPLRQLELTPHASASDNGSNSVGTRRGEALGPGRGLSVRIFSFRTPGEVFARCAVESADLLVGEGELATALRRGGSGAQGRKRLPGHSLRMQAARRPIAATHSASSTTSPPVVFG